MYAIQLDFFKTPEQCEMDALRLRNAKLELLVEKLRKSLYGGRNEDRARILILEEDVTLIKRHICRGQT